MPDQWIRTRMVIGPEAMDRLRRSRVAVFGLGGVGGYAAEALARAGVGALDLVDHDRVSLSNLNRQIYALHSTVGKYKADVAAERIADISPDCRVTAYRVFFMPETREGPDLGACDYVIDAIDTVKGKLALIGAARAAGTPVISCMGTGNKLDPSALRVADIEETSVCPLARVMRAECRKRGISGLKVVFSTEPPVRPADALKAEARRESGAGTDQEAARTRRDIPGSAVFVPAAAGLLLASAAVRDLIG